MVILNGNQCRRSPNVGISLLQSQVFLDPGDRILQKLGGGCLCECDAPPHGWIGVGTTSPVSKMEGNF